MAIAPPRGRANSNKHSICPIHSLRQIRCKGQPPRLDIAGHQILKARLINWNLTLIQFSDFFWGFVDTDHLMPKIREADPRNQANIACANHCNPHGLMSLFGQSCSRPSSDNNRDTSPQTRQPRLALRFVACSLLSASKGLHRPMWQAHRLLAYP